MSLETEQIIALIRALQEQALESQRREADLRKTIQDLAIQVAAIQIAPVQTETPPIKVYKPVDITGSVRCDETLDAVKCLPDFMGTQETYVSWRQAANAAYHMFRIYKNSSRHYQAVVIIRSKVKGPADAVLSSFGTILNFDAILHTATSARYTLSSTS